MILNMKELDPEIEESIHEHYLDSIKFPHLKPINDIVLDILEGGGQLDDRNENIEPAVR